ncbi:DUF2909 domain-containing protein [Vibrio sp. T187]|uniref:DUF2909 domain-containing protein n=1 Tax=Vibrio TaxID=662 RepID=UPI0010C9EC17|nr:MULTISPECIES: DUF2909 domain-containing protein [Vibrio]MBW3695582.1 DUF2909 domain-containing protein [Vibrio sp. T187]
MIASLIFKIALVLFLLFIMLNLAKALFHIVKGEEDSKPISHYLGRRVLISAIVVVLLFIALLSGWIQPNPRPF